MLDHQADVLGLGAVLDHQADVPDHQADVPGPKTVPATADSFSTTKE